MDKELHALTAEIYLGHNLRVENNRRQMPLEVALDLARYYLEREKWIPAIKRFQKVISDYDTTIFVEEALHRLVELNYKIGLENEAEKYALLLGYNYKSSKWYEASYRIVNKDYKIKKISNKKEKENILKKFKKLFK